MSPYRPATPSPPFFLPGRRVHRVTSLLSEVSVKSPTGPAWVYYEVPCVDSRLQSFTAFRRHSKTWQPRQAMQWFLKTACRSSPMRLGRYHHHGGHGHGQQKTRGYFGSMEEMGVSKNGGTPNEWFTMENPINVDDLGVDPYFRKPPHIATTSSAL